MQIANMNQPATATVIPFKALRAIRAQPSLPKGFFIPAKTIARIDALTDKSSGPHGAWAWLGSVGHGNAYPVISFKDQETGKRTQMNVHRILMCLQMGRRLERSELVLHDRGTPRWSVNPAHLRIGTQRENMRDAVAEKRMRRPLNKAEVLEVARYVTTKRLSVAEIAKLFNVSNECICRIREGRTHGDVTGFGRKDRRRAA